MYIKAKELRLEFEDVRFENNMVLGEAQAKKYLDQYIGTHEVLFNEIFNSNILTTEFFKGGAVYLDSTSPLSTYSFVNCDFQENTAPFGGGIYSVHKLTD